MINEPSIMTTKISKNKKRVAIIGGGPSGLFVYKRFLDSGADFIFEVFEEKNRLGSGMPYSREGAGEEHVTNVSSNEIPELITTISEWIATLSPEYLEKFKVTQQNFNDYKVLPRLLFGEYLSAQFNLLRQKADEVGILTIVHLSTKVTDVLACPEKDMLYVQVGGKQLNKFDYVIMCTGHMWPRTYEDSVQNYFD